MGFSLTSPAPEKSDPTAKNRVWGFFGDAEQSHRQNRPQTKQPRQGNRLTTTKIASGRTYWPSRDPIEEEYRPSEPNSYGFVTNSPISLVDLLGLKIVAPPEDFLKGVKGGCKWFSLQEFIDLQEKWSGKKMTRSEKKNLGQGCIGICKAALADVSTYKKPEDKDGVVCYAGAGGRAKVEAEAKAKCDKSSPPVIWSKRGKWVEGFENTKDGQAVDPNSVTGVDSENNFDYVTKLGGFYVDAKQHIWKPGSPRRPNVDDLDLNKPNMIKICRDVIPKGGYPAEIWCYRCCKKSNRGYRDGY